MVTSLLSHEREGALQVREVGIDIASDSLGHDIPLRQPSAARDSAKIKWWNSLLCSFFLHIFKHFTLPLYSFHLIHLYLFLIFYDSFLNLFIYLLFSFILPPWSAFLLFVYMEHLLSNNILLCSLIVSFFPFIFL